MVAVLMKIAQSVRRQELFQKHVIGSGKILFGDIGGNGHYSNVEYSGMPCTWCGTINPNLQSYTCQHWICNSCGYSISKCCIYTCANHYSGKSYSFSHPSKKETQTCSKCSGKGSIENIILCSHNYSEPHTYCIHR